MPYPQFYKILRDGKGKRRRAITRFETEELMVFGTGEKKKVDEEIV